MSKTTPINVGTDVAAAADVFRTPDQRFPSAVFDATNHSNPSNTLSPRSPRTERKKRLRKTYRAYRVRDGDVAPTIPGGTAEVKHPAQGPRKSPPEPTGAIATVLPAAAVPPHLVVRWRWGSRRAAVVADDERPVGVHGEGSPGP